MSCHGEHLPRYLDMLSWSVTVAKAKTTQHSHPIHQLVGAPSVSWLHTFMRYQSKENTGEEMLVPIQILINLCFICNLAFLTATDGCFYFIFTVKRKGHCPIKANGKVGQSEASHIILVLNLHVAVTTFAMNAVDSLCAQE